MFLERHSRFKKKKKIGSGHQKIGSGHRNHFGYILCSQRWRSSIQLGKTRLGADCGSDHELLIAKFRLKLKTFNFSGENH